MAFSRKNFARPGEGGGKGEWVVPAIILAAIIATILIH